MWLRDRIKEIFDPWGYEQDRQRNNLLSYIKESINETKKKNMPKTQRKDLGNVAVGKALHDALPGEIVEVAVGDWAEHQKNHMVDSIFKPLPLMEWLTSQKEEAMASKGWSTGFNYGTQNFTMTLRISMAQLHKSGISNDADTTALIEHLKVVIENELGPTLSAGKVSTKQLPEPKKEKPVMQPGHFEKQDAYFVIVIKDPTTKEVEEEGKGCQLITPVPILVMASSEQAAAMKATRKLDTEVDLDSPLVRVQVCPFAEQTI